jgi:hypothetical protein
MGNSRCQASERKRYITRARDSGFLVCGQHVMIGHDSFFLYVGNDSPLNCSQLLVVDKSDCICSSTTCCPVFNRGQSQGYHRICCTELQVQLCLRNVRKRMLETYALACIYGRSPNSDRKFLASRYDRQHEMLPFKQNHGTPSNLRHPKRRSAFPPRKRAHAAGEKRNWRRYFPGSQP